MGNAVQSVDPRPRAKALGGATAREAILASPVAMVYFKMTAVQIGQMQRALDAVVLDPVISSEAKAAYQRGTKVYGQIVTHDPAAVRRSDQIMRNYIPITATDKRIRLDYKQLIDAKALKPLSDNPDEYEYWAKIHKSLDSIGVWLRFEPKLVRDPDDRRSEERRVGKEC